MDRKINEFFEIGSKTLILVVDDDDFTLRTVSRLLKPHYTVETVSSGEECLAALEQKHPDLILLDIQMPVMGGFEVMEMIQLKGLSDIPVIFLTGEHDAQVQVACLREGAMDFIEKPAHPEILLQRIARTLELDAARRFLSREIEHLSSQVERYKDEQLALLRKTMMDPLTGIFNRHGLRAAFENMVSDGGSYTLTIIDMDHFKSINDTYGHLVGDRYIKELAGVLATEAAGAVASRFGGDEFCLLFSGMTRGEVRITCERIGQAFLDCGACCEFQPATLSFGAAEWDGKLTPEDLLSRADDALYKAKKFRHCIKFYEES